MKKTLILVAGLIVLAVFLASCGTLTTEVTYTFNGDGDNPKVGETVRFESSLDFELEDYDENQEFVCEVKKHKRFYGETYTLKDKHAKKHSKHVKKLKFKKSEGLEDRIESKLNRTKKDYEWDFDADGETDSTKKKPKHIFTEPGTYWVSVFIVVKNKDKQSKETYGEITASGGVEVIVDPADPDDPPVIGPYIDTWEFINDVDENPAVFLFDALYNFTFENDGTFELRFNSYEAVLFDAGGMPVISWEPYVVWAVRGTMVETTPGVLTGVVEEVWFVAGLKDWTSTAYDWGMVMSQVSGPNFDLTYSIAGDTMTIDLGLWLLWQFWQSGSQDFTRQ